MNIVLSHTGGEPIYRQIYRQISEQISRGEISENINLPSIRSFARELSVSVITIKKAYEYLEKESFIYSIPGKGFFTKPCSVEKRNSNNRNYIKSRLKEVFKESKNRGFSLDELKEVINDEIRSIYDCY